MDPFVLILLAAFGALALWLGVIAKLSGSGYDQVDWKSSQVVAERREALEAEDAEEMLAAFNSRRARRGERALTLEELELRTAQVGPGARPARTGPPTRVVEGTLSPHSGDNVPL